MKEPATVGQCVVAALLSYQLGITTDRAMKLYVRGRELPPSWEEIGKALLGSIASAPPGSLRPARGLQIVRRKSGSEKTNPRKDRG